MTFIDTVSHGELNDKTIMLNVHLVQLHCKCRYFVLSVIVIGLYYIGRFVMVPVVVVSLVPQEISL